jgi:hypothetical protein
MNEHGDTEITEEERTNVRDLRGKGTAIWV